LIHTTDYGIYRPMQMKEENHLCAQRDVLSLPHLNALIKCALRENHLKIEMCNS